MSTYIQWLENTYFGWWIKNYKVSLMALVLLVGYGLYALLALPKESSPTIKFGLVSITTVYPWANPLDVDTLVTEKVESEIKNLPWIDSISSTSSLGVSSVVITLDNGVDVASFINDVESRVDAVELPTDALDPRVIEISTDNEQLFEMMLYGSKEYMTMNQLRSLAMQFKQDIKGKGSIVDVRIDDVSWDSDYDIWVYLDQGKIESLGLSVASIVSQIRAYNASLPLGSYRIWELTYDYRISNELSSIDDLQRIPILAWVRYVYLEEIASITRSYKTQTISYGWTNGIEDHYAIGMTVLKKPWGNIFADAKSAKQIIGESMNKIRFRGLSVAYTRDLSDIIIKDYVWLAWDGVTAVLLVTIITALFIGIRQSVIASIAMICSFFITFIVLQWLGLTMNFLTNFSLILAFGSGIDTVIVFIEAAYANTKRWFNPKTAMLLAVNTYKSANINTSLINLCVFIPLLVLPGITGKFLSFIPITIFTTLLGSLLMSLTVNNALFYKLNPKRDYYYSDNDDNDDDDVILNEQEQAILNEERVGKSIKPASDKPAVERFIDKMMWWYVSLLHYILESRLRRILTIWIPVAAVILSFVFLSPRIGFKLFPSWDNPYATIVIESRQGTTIDRMDQDAQGIDAILAQVPEIQNYLITIRPSVITINTVLVDKEERDRDSFQIQDDILSQLEPLEQQWYRIEWRVQAWWPPAGKAVGIKLIAVNKDSINELKAVSEDFEEYLRSVTGTVNVTNSSVTAPWQFEIVFDRDRLAQLGLTPQDVQFEISNILNGQKAGTMIVDRISRDIRVWYIQDNEEVDPSRISDLMITTRSWPIKIGSVATIQSNQSLTSITRQDSQITTTVESDLVPWVNPTSIQPQLIAFAEQYEFPAGISFVAWGENEANRDLIVGAWVGLIVAIVLAFIILVYQFNSFSLPAIVLYSIFTAFLWVNLGLWATGNPYSLAVMIWFISLIGVVVNTAIFLVDRIKQNLDKWSTIIDAIVEAWQVRFTPIVISTITALLWVWPVVTQDEFYAWLGYTVIFGLIFSAVITLLTVPVLVYGVKKRGESPIDMWSNGIDAMDVFQALDREFDKK